MLQALNLLLPCVHDGCVYVCPKMDEKTLTHYLMPNKKTKIQPLKVAVRAQI